MNAPLYAGVLISLLLWSPIASSAELFPMPDEHEFPAEYGYPAEYRFFAEYGFPDGRKDSEALRDLMASVMDFYAPALKAKILSIEKRCKDMTHFSGSIYLEGEKTLFTPQISGEAAVSNEQTQEEPLVNWSIKTSLDFNSGAVGMEFWKDIGFGRFSFSNEVEQDFSEEFEYKCLLKIEKRF
ncbi:MAG: hypothetical protein P8Y63_01920 [Deltaproteobacteria bacterium]|jgi:hypothetical protein